MRSGKLRHSVVIQKPSRSLDTYGEGAPTWAELDTVWAAVEPLKGTERLEAQQLNPDVETQIRARYLAGLDESCRVLIPKQVTTLAASVSATDSTTISIADATGFPTAESYRARIDSEIVLITAGFAASSWTVTRGADSTTAATHASGANVEELAVCEIAGVVNIDQRDIELQLLCHEKGQV